MRTKQQQRRHDERQQRNRRISDALMAEHRSYVPMFDTKERKFNYQRNLPPLPDIRVPEQVTPVPFEDIAERVKQGLANMETTNYREELERQFILAVWNDPEWQAEREREDRLFLYGTEGDTK